MQVLQQTDDMLLGPKRNRAVARLLLVFVTTLCSLGLVTGLAAVFEHLARTPQAIASSTGQISVTGYPITTVPVGALPSLPAATATQRLLMHGQAQVSNGLVLVPGVLPSQGSTGELYYDQGTNRPYFYNGSSFISLQSTAGTQPSVTNQTFVTNTTSPTTVVEQINNGAALSGLTTDGVVYATSATTVSTLPLMADGVLVTNASSQPVLSQILPTTIQNNIISTGVLTSGSIAPGFGAISTNSSIATSAMLQGGTIIVGADGSSQPASVTIRGGAATGTDATGASTVFDAGNGTGNGGSGDLIFRTASSNVLPVTLGDTAEFEAYTQSSMSTTFNVTSHANMVMVVGVNQQDNTQSVSSVAWNGSTAGWTRIGSQASAGSVVELWYLVNPVSGSHTLTINFSATSGNNHQFVGAETFYNVSQTAPIAASNTGAGTTAGTTSVAVATSSGQVAVDVIGDNQFCLGAPGAGQTRTWADQLGPNTILGGSYKTTSAGSTTMSWGVTSSCTWESVIAAISPVSGSVSDTLTDRLHVTATGNVGINISSPQYTLDIAGGGAHTNSDEFYYGVSGTECESYGAIGSRYYQYAS